MAYGVNKLAQRNAARVDSLPPPVGGWNARDSLANMEATDAVQLNNLFPTISNVVLRGGYTEHATGMSGAIETLMVYAGGSAEEMFAIDGTGLDIYNVTASGAVGAAEVTGLSTAKWEHINVSTPGGNFLYAVNGVDKPLLYDGSVWTSIDAVSTPAITGVTTTDLDNITLFKNQVWFIQKNTLVAWYLPTLSVGGAAAYIDLRAVAKYGGYLVDVDTWTIDAGYGVDDNLVFITSQGEAIVYAGTDPSDATKWSLIGVWKLGSPIGKRCLYKYGGDLLVLTYDGLLPLAAALQSSRLDPRVSLSNKIQGAIAEATVAYGGNFGWDITYTAKYNALWVNVPVSTGNQEQFVMNTITKSWCRFTGWNANCWEVFKDNPYFGGTGSVYKAWDSGYEDDGANIETSCFQAFNYFDARGVKKYFTRARPSLFTNGSPGIFVGMNVDFALNDTATPLTFNAPVGALWDSGIWDSSVWGDSLVISNQWQGITGIGFCGSLQFKSISKGTAIEWASTDVVYQTGWAGI
jgi:hypothetical protein